MGGRRGAGLRPVSRATVSASQRAGACGGACVETRPPPCARASALPPLFPPSLRLTAARRCVRACVCPPVRACVRARAQIAMEASAGGGAGGAAGRRWYFTREQLDRSPSRRAGLDPDKELSYRQQAANLLQDMGQRLNVSQLTINTAIVYMHRFYMVQSFTQFHRNSVVPAALFLAAKVEEQPRKLEHVIKVAHACLHHQETPLDTKSEAYLQQAQDLVILESIILQTLGFEITIDHPHTHVVKCTQLVRASKDLAQTSYFMATNRVDKGSEFPGFDFINTVSVKWLQTFWLLMHISVSPHCVEKRLITQAWRRNAARALLRPRVDARWHRFHQSLFERADS
ncbi:cyclin-T1 isoform X2 [Strix aluco]|uniref:cyclin-T1 isoform X2 n=1 Tax=Strix aluco TaxID=111821 RepID=UPI003DA2C871